MIGLEYNNFVLLDKREYILVKNNDILKLKKKNNKEGYSETLALSQTQRIIDEVTQFFEIKYPDNMFYEMIHIANPNQEEIKKCLKIGKLLDTNQLKYRIYGLDTFFSCPPAQYFRLEKKEKEWLEPYYTLVHLDDAYNIPSHELDKLKEYGYIDDIEGITKMEDLLGRFIGNSNNVDYSELENFVKNHKYNLELRNKVLEIIPLSMIYSKNTLPEYGYIRAKRFIRMINKEYDLNLTTDRIDKIMGIDYSDTKKVKELAKIA